MKKIKLFAPLMGISLTCATAISVASCATPSELTIKVQLDKDVENITLATEPKDPVKGRRLIIILTADENYTIDPTSIQLLSGGQEVEFVTDMSDDNVVATLIIEKENVNDDMTVIAEAIASEDGKKHNYLSEDGEFVPYVATHETYSGSMEFESEAQVFTQYMVEASSDHEIIEDDFLYDFNASFGQWYTQITEAGYTFEALEAQIKMESITFDPTNGIYKLIGHAYNKISFTVPGLQNVTITQSVDTNFTNAYIDYGAYEVSSGVWDRTLGCCYDEAVYSHPELLELTDWKVEGQGMTQQGKEIVGSFTYENWESGEEPGTIDTDLSYLCGAFHIHSPHYMSTVPYIKP